MQTHQTPKFTSKFKAKMIAYFCFLDFSEFSELEATVLMTFGKLLLTIVIATTAAAAATSVRPNCIGINCSQRLPSNYGLKCWRTGSNLRESFSCRHMQMKNSYNNLMLALRHLYSWLFKSRLSGC